MQLLNPYFLLFGVVLAIPVIVHLFNLRKFKTVYYSDTSLLEEIVLKSKKKRTLKELLVLATRLLLLAGLVISFAYPFFGNQQKSQIGKEMIVVDNSSSTAVYSGEKSVFDEIKSAVTEVSGNQFQFVSNDKKVLNELNKESLVSLVNETKNTVKQLRLKEINTLALLKAGTDEVTVFSPFPKSFELDGLGERKLNLVHFESKQVAKILIDTLWIEQKGDINTVILNYQSVGEGHSYEAKLFVNNEFRGVKKMETGQLKFDTHFSKSVNLSVVRCYDETGLEVGAFYFVLREKKNHTVTLIGEVKNSPLAKAFSGKEDFTLNEYKMSRIDYSQLYASDLVFVRFDSRNKGSYKDVIHQVLERGIKVCLFFEGTIDKNVLQSFQIKSARWSGGQLVKVKQPDSKLYKGVYLGKVRGVSDFPKVKRDTKLTGLLQPLLANEFNEPVLCQSITKPQLYVSTIDFTKKSAFTSHSLFIPTVYQFLFYENLQRELFVRPNSYFTLPKAFSLAKEISITSLKDTVKTDIQPITQGEKQLLLLNENLKSGWYSLKKDTTEVLVAINEQHHISEYEYRTLEELEELASAHENVTVFSSTEFQKQNNALLTAKEDFPLWKWFVIFALLFLVVEMLVLKLKSSK